MPTAFGRSAILALALSFGFLLPNTAHAEFKVPALTGAVVDDAGVLNPSTRSSMEAALREVRSKGGPQINVLTVQSLEGLTIEQASIQVTDAWKLGGQKADDGILFMISMGDRRMRIEVGQGLEGVLTDVESKRIIEDRVIPYFRAGRPGDGIVVGVSSILQKTSPELAKALGESPRLAKKSRSRDQGIPVPLLIFIVIVFLFLGRGGRRGGLLGALAGSALGSSGRGGGWSGGGGGGWSGGGGGFSGGGASGGW